MWIRLPELPIEFYEHNALLKIGRAIGLVLRIDVHTANGAKGCFAHLCVQVNLNKPLVRTIYLGRLKQSIQYKGVSTLFFECGRIGHNKEVCPFLVHGNSKGAQEKQSGGGLEEQGGVATPPKVERALASQRVEYGERMIVTQHKPMNRARDKLNGSIVSQTSESSQTSYDKTLLRVGEVDKVVGKRKEPQIQASRSLREESKNTMSHHNMTVDGKGPNTNGAHANPRQKAKVTIRNQKV